MLTQRSGMARPLHLQVGILHSQSVYFPNRVEQVPCSAFEPLSGAITTNEQQTT